LTVDCWLTAVRVQYGASFNYRSSIGPIDKVWYR
jgi:hypothetical protein